jgi:hypothetical protein
VSHLREYLPDVSIDVRAAVGLAMGKLQLDEPTCAGIINAPPEERRATLLHLLRPPAGGARQLACIEVNDKCNRSRQLNLAV